MAETTIVTIKDEAAMARAGAWLAGIVRPGDVLLLEGPLGAGKTTLARGLIQKFCGARDVPSPTFTLVETYENEGRALWHFDLYRLEKPEDVWELGLEEALDEAIALIEWPDRITGLLPKNALHLLISIEDEHREIRFTMPGKWQERLNTTQGVFGLEHENRLD